MAEIKCILAEQAGQGGGGGIGGVVPTKLILKTNPSKLVYRVGDTFSLTGFTGTVQYGVSGSALSMGTAEIPGDIDLSSIGCSPDGAGQPNRALAKTDTAVTIYYTENDVTVSVNVGVTVRESGLDITGPTKNVYTWGDAFSTTGLVVKDKSGRTISTYTMKIGSVALANNTVLNNSAFVIGTNTVTVDCTDADGFEQTGIFDITINKVTLAIPTQSGTLTYNGSALTPVWNPAHAASLVTITYGSDRTNAGSKSATAALVDKTHYQWTGATTADQTLSWSVGKATLAASNITVTGETTIDKNNLTRTINVKTPTGETAAISISPTSVTGLTIASQTQSANSRDFKFTGDGSTAITGQVFQISVAEGKNYKAGANVKSFTIKTSYWEFGAGNGEAADADWWKGLSDYLATNPDANTLKGFLGKTKTITLTTAILGTTSHLVRVIGYNLDRSTSATTRSTLTWQTANCLAQNTYYNGTGSAPYSSSDTANASTDTNTMVWRYSYIRNTLCKNYYNALPFKSSVKTVSKGTCTVLNSSQAGTPTYIDEQVFLPSDCEMGFPKGADYSNGKGYSASYDEFDKQNTSKTAYQYYTSDSVRIKKLGDNGSARYYWERSLPYNTANLACRVYSDGKPYADVYYDSCGFAPAFVI